ncbi:MAG: DUF929 family protein [Candidatus Micrarchaeia archaeon]
MEKGKKEKIEYAIIGVALVVSIITFALVRNNSSRISKDSISYLIKYDNVEVNSSVMSELYSISNNNTIADAIGMGNTSLNFSYKMNDYPLYFNGKPVVMYIGADYCPYCSMTRWGLVIALMRFGNFSRLHYMTSSYNDVFPNSPTFTFYNSSYLSNEISFMEAETHTNIINKSSGFYYPLQQLNSIENAVFNKYDLNNKTFQGAIPFLDVGNITYSVGSVASPQVYAGMNWSSVIESMKNPNTNIAKSIIGEANIYTAEICAATNNTPNVCNYNYVRSIESALRAQNKI